MMALFKTRLTVSLSAVLLSTQALLARDQLYSIGMPAKAGTFNVINGQPCLLRKGERGDPGNALDQVGGDRLVHFGSRQPLCYPLEGDNPNITFEQTRDTSAIWEIPPGGESRELPIRAAEGKFKGWYLDWEATETEVKSAKETFHTRRLILVEKPAMIRLFSRYAVAP